MEKVGEVLKIVLTLSHRQPSVVHSFSVNKSLLVENLSAKSLISQRIVYDHMNFHNVTPENFAKVSEILEMNMKNILKKNEKKNYILRKI